MIAGSTEEAPQMTQPSEIKVERLQVRSEAERVVLRARYEERERQARRALSGPAENDEYSTLFDHVPFAR